MTTDKHKSPRAEIGYTERPFLYRRKKRPSQRSIEARDREKERIKKLLEDL